MHHLFFIILYLLFLHIEGVMQDYILNEIYLNGSSAKYGYYGYYDYQMEFCMQSLHVCVKKYQNLNCIYTYTYIQNKKETIQILWPNKLASLNATLVSKLRPVTQGVQILEQLAQLKKDGINFEVFCAEQNIQNLSINQKQPKGMCAE